MTIDLGAIYATASGIVDQVLATSGTTVSIGRLADGKGQGTTDPVTLVHTEDEPDVIVDETEAFIADLTAGMLTNPLPTATPVMSGDKLLLLRPEIVEVRQQDIITVLTCADERLVERVMDVETVLDSSPGVLRMLHARPRTNGPGAP